MKLVRIAALGVLAFALAAVVGVGRPERARSLAGQQGGITVTGNGTVTTVPDRAEASFGVESQGATAAQALAANAAEMRKVIAVLKAAGVAAADIQTQQVSISPRYTQDGQAIVGYSVQNSVSAKVRDLDKAGAVIDAAVGAGANQVLGPSLSRSDRDELYRSALKAAVADAKAKAQAIAAAAGASVGAVKSVVEGGGPVPVPSEAVRAEAQPGTPIEPGTQEIQAIVSVTFAIS